MPDSQSSSCYYYSSNSSVTVQIGMPSSINTDLDYYKADLLNFRDGTLLGSNLVKLPKLMGNAEDPLTTMFILRSTGSGSIDRFYVNLTPFDKCSQYSLQPLTIACDHKGNLPISILHMYLRILTSIRQQPRHMHTA